jgi:hypothetical protein
MEPARAKMMQSSAQIVDERDVPANVALRGVMGDEHQHRRAARLRRNTKRIPEELVGDLTSSLVSRLTTFVGCVATQQTLDTFQACGRLNRLPRHLVVQCRNCLIHPIGV